MKPSISHEEATIQSFRRDPEFAAEYLNAVFKDGDQDEVLLALRRIAKAFAKEEDLNATLENSKVLYQLLSPIVNPQLRNIEAILSTIGMKLAITPAVTNLAQ